MMNSKRPRGIILVLVLVVVAILALASLSFCDLMSNEHKAAQTSGQQVQARALAESGAELARQFLDRTPADQADAGGIYDNPGRFQGVLAADVDNPADRGHFTLVAPVIQDCTITGIRYGLQDESTRINLGTLLQMDKKSPGAATTILMGLPGMTADISDSILFWIDPTATPRPQGAGADYYASLTPPYAPRNGTPQSIDELLLVRGVTPQLLYGLDAARMGLAEASTDGTIEGVDNSDHSMDHGWAAYLTLYSAESNLKSDGTAKIDVSSNNLQKLHNDLVTAGVNEISATFIVAYRAYPHQKATGQNLLPFQPSLVQIQTLTPSQTLATVLDLIDTAITVTTGTGSTSTSQGFKSPITVDSLPTLMAVATVGSGTVAGRININQAPRTVLLCIPGISSDTVDQIISQRVINPTTDDQTHQYGTWLLSEGIVPLAQMKTLLPFVNAGGSVYRAQILGALDGGGPTARIEAILDASNSPTCLLSWKDVSGVPGGFPAEAAAPATSTGQ